jgi:dTDP-4-amino-4,6-dideoxygalactose transaminase
VHYIPLHHHPIFKKFSNKKDLLCVEQFYKKEVSLPIYPDLKLFQIKKVINEVINLI